MRGDPALKEMDSFEKFYSSYVVDGKISHRKQPIDRAYVSITGRLHCAGAHESDYNSIRHPVKFLCILFGFFLLMWYSFAHS